jgi:hypothetical protein
MTLQQALTAEVGDRLIFVFNGAILKEGDAAILVERSRDINGFEKDTGGWFYIPDKKECVGGNIQDFVFDTTMTK